MIHAVPPSFHFAIYSVKPRLQDYLLETDHGMKRLVFWQELEPLLWSFQWREQLAQNGYRYIERFIRNRDGNPYSICSWGAYTISDYYEGPAIAIDRNQDLTTLGKIHALIHQAIGRSQDLYNPYSIYQEQLYIMENNQKQSKQLSAILNEHDLQALTQRVEAAKSYFWKGLRMDELEGLSVSVPAFMPENLYQWGGEWYITGLFHCKPTAIHRDTASLLRRIFFEREGSMDAVYAYLEGYQAVRPYPRKEGYLLISYLLYPDALLGLAGQIKEEQWENEQTVYRIEEALHHQENWDSLALGVSEWIRSTIS